MKEEEEYCECCKEMTRNCYKDTVRSHVIFEKYVPHKYVYRYVCIDCIQSKKQHDLIENGFIDIGYSMAH